MCIQRGQPQHLKLLITYFSRLHIVTVRAVVGDQSPVDGRDIGCGANFSVSPQFPGAWLGAKQRNRVYRRTVLAGLGATIVDSAVAGSGLTVGPTDDGGFTVRLDFHESWKVGYAELEQGWGQGATVTTAALQSLPGVMIGGHHNWERQPSSIFLFSAVPGAGLVISG